jgi:hypothetical protein
VTGVDVLDAVERAVVERFGTEPQRASRSFVGVDPIEVLRFAIRPAEYAYVTLGMSRHPMTGAGESVQAADGPRAELVLVVLDPIDAQSDVWRQLAVLAATPAVEGFVYRDGASVELGQPLVAGSRCTGIVASVADDVAPVRTSAGPVEIFRVLPATSAELAWCRARGTAALREKWSADRVDLLDLTRDSVRLS